MDLQLIGYGAYGKVYKINDKLAVKEFALFTDYIRESFWLSFVKFQPGFCVINKLDSTNKRITMNLYETDLYKLSKSLSLDKKISLIDSIIEQLLPALIFLHERGISHNDIKLSNVFCNYNNENNTIQCYLGDFSLMSIKGDSFYRRFYKCLKWSTSPSTNLQKDIWAFGALIVQFLTLERSSCCFNYYNEKQTNFWDIEQCFPDIASLISPIIKDYLSSFLQFDPNKRYRIRTENTYIDKLYEYIYSLLSNCSDQQNLDICCKYIIDISCLNYNISDENIETICAKLI